MNKKKILVTGGAGFVGSLLEVPEEYDTDTDTSVEVNFGLLKYKRTVKKIHKKEDSK